MKFSCEKCQTRYSIGDEKVAGKVLKIRCKTCGNIMVVREAGVQQQAAAAQPLALAQAGGAVKSAPVPAAAPAPTSAPQTDERKVAAAAAVQAIKPAGRAADVDWYVAIKGKQHGPVKHDDVVKFFKDGKITERSYCWHEAMSAWTRLRDAPEFKEAVEAHLAAVARGAALSGGAAAGAPKRSPPPPPEEQGAEVVSLDAARQQKQARDAAERGHGATSAQAPDPFAAVSAQQGGALIDAPRDSTRVFIMQAGLHNRASKQKAIALSALGIFGALLGLLALDYAGVVEIPGLHSVVVAAVQNKDDVPKGVKLAAWDEDDDANAELKCKLNPGDCPKIMAEVKEKKAKRRAKAVATAGDDVVDAPRGDVVARTGDTGAAFGSNTAAAQKIGDVFKGDVGRTMKAPTAVIETPQVASTNIDVEGVGKVVKQGQEAIKNCMDQAAKTGEQGPGKQYLTITLRPNGTVGAAYFKNAAVNAQGIGQCITGVAKRWKFAPFPGEATDVEIPLILSVN